MRNLVDFTTKEEYEELDRQTKRYRRERLFLNVLLVIAFLSCFATMIKLISGR